MLSRLIYVSTAVGPVTTAVTGTILRSAQAHNPANGITTWVAIGISSGEFADTAMLKLPILDIYGERDFPQVLQKAEARAA